MKFVSKFFIIFLFIVSLVYLQIHVKQPSNDRNWNDDQKVLPSAKVEGDMVTIFNIRNFDYTSVDSYTPRYYDKSFDLTTIKNVWYVVEPFEGVPGSAHTFLSFEFENNNFVSISIEIRKEKGESFHPLKGLLNMYELTYVVADENDVIALRTNHRKDLVYLYKTTAGKEKAKELFLSMVARINSLHDTPEFYNTVTNNCTTNIIQHINAITPKKIPWLSWESVFPEYSDVLAYKLGLLDTTLSFEDLQKKSLINDKALQYAHDENFSVKIRQP